MDHDPLYTHAFREILNNAGVHVIQTRVERPQQNGYAESFVASIKRECINHLIFFGENSLRKAVTECVQHYHFERTHQGLDNNVPLPNPAPTLTEDALIVKS